MMILMTVDYRLAFLIESSSTFQLVTDCTHWTVNTSSEEKIGHHGGGGGTDLCSVHAGNYSSYFPKV